MKPRQLPIVAVVVLALVLACALYAVAASRKPPATGGSAPQWEYLVVADSNVTFADVGSKRVPFIEAIVVEEKMNKLGEQGWELVAVLGAIGGDQEFVFKRRR